MYTKKELKPAKYKHFSSGTKYGNTLLTRIRVGRSFLNEHKFTIGLTDSPECLCHFRSESPQHYFLDCFQYLLERQTLFTLIEHYVPNFTNWTKKKKLDLILRGINVDNPDLLSLNTTLTKAVQNFITKTNRFSTPDQYNTFICCFLKPPLQVYNNILSFCCTYLPILYLCLFIFS